MVFSFEHFVLSFSTTEISSEGYVLYSLLTWIRIRVKKQLDPDPHREKQQNKDQRRIHSPARNVVLLLGF